MLIDDCAMLLIHYHPKPFWNIVRFHLHNTDDMTVLEKPLTNLQLELLKLYSLNLSEPQLTDIKRLLARYFAETASDEMDKLWEEKGWTNETMDEWLQGKDTDKKIRTA